MHRAKAPLVLLLTARCSSLQVVQFAPCRQIAKFGTDLLLPRVRPRAACIFLSELSVKTFKPTVSPAASTTLHKRLSELHALTEEHGLAFPSSNNSSPSLMRWAARQRALYRQNLLPPDLVDELDGLFFVWDPLQAKWNAKYDELESFYEDNGHCNVPSAYPAAPDLSRWVQRQRQLHRRGDLSSPRRDALLALDFIFDPQSARWEERLGEYAAAVAGQPRSIPTSLRQWAARQRKAHAEGRLPLERVEALHQLPGWTWTAPTGRGPTALRRLGLRLTRELSSEEQSVANGVVSEAEASHRPVAAALRSSCYSRSRSAGRALVISVGARRDNAAIELADAREALRALGYFVVTVENPSASELRASLIAHASQDDWNSHASSVVALMAHGHGSSIEGQDGSSVSLGSLFGLLAPSAAPALEGKPKIFLVQACRKGEPPVLTLAQPQVETGSAEEVQMAEDGAHRRMKQAAQRSGRSGPEIDTSAPSADTKSPRQLCEEHDFLWGYATTGNHVAYRGALFAALREVVGDFGWETTWVDILSHTNERLCAWSASRPIGQPLPSMDIRSTCRGPGFAPSDLVLDETDEQTSDEQDHLRITNTNGVP